MSRYSNDLRLRVIKLYKEKENNNDNKNNKTNKTSICKIFNISRPTLDSWLILEQQEKLLEIAVYHHGKVSKVDSAKLANYIEQNSDLYYREIAEHFNIKTSQAHRLATKIGIVVKKNKKSTKKEMKT
jgi:transposase-like protein